MKREKDCTDFVLVIPLPPQSHPIHQKKKKKVQNKNE